MFNRTIKLFIEYTRPLKIQFKKLKIDKLVIINEIDRKFNIQKDNISNL